MKKKPPLRRVVDRRQSFLTSMDFPHGWIVETLECGHERKEGIFPDMPETTFDANDNRVPIRHQHNAERRRCAECVEAR